MSLLPLLDKQILRIDDHRRGNREIKNWDDNTKDIHIDKRTKYKVDGKIRNVIIRIPINSDREITTTIDGEKSKIPASLEKEIKQALRGNPEKTKAFTNQIISELKNYESILENEQKASAALERISKHFDLKWTGEKISTFVTDKLEAYTQIYEDKTNRRYFITATPFFLELSDITGWSRHEIWLNRFR
jgi:hypothetical protein